MNYNLKKAILNVLENKVSCASEDAHQLIEQHFSEKPIGKRLYDYYSTLLQKLK
ncbi:MAG: hypothetical protein KatS3mg028_0165 [Bacteroidia bacterium]|nr:MAG: hypothetical protein KatS3mg028_0165 [Bacteroidia bacterium]